ncbi:hypothetical protein [Streptomyces sp. NPDC091371]|uniref:hypothetical protein n=1 Tax=Streptomyces sp. NPDC091371 TaxID=3155303 RepID=UPI00344219E0
MQNSNPNPNPERAPDQDPADGEGTRTDAWLRVGLAFLTAVQFGVGCWALLFPYSFFSVPWVGMGMAYNVHLMTDYGAMSLATSVALGAGAVTMQRTVIRTGLASYLVFATAHLAIHIGLVDHLPPGRRVPLLASLALAAVIPAVLLVLTGRTGRTAGTRASG